MFNALPDHTSPISKRQLGADYRAAALELLGRLGYGSARQIAKALWGCVTPSTRKMATRMLSRLIAEGLLVAKRDTGGVNGERLVALTTAGTRQLTYLLAQARPHARDWLRHAHAHRTAANSVFVAGCLEQPEGLDAGCTELEIRSADVPPHLSKFDFDLEGAPAQKIPDCIFNMAPGYIWVEVENNWRSTKDFNKLIGFLRAMFYLKLPPFFAVWLVVTAPGAKTIGQRLRKALGPGDPHTDGRGRVLRELDARILADKVQVFTLDRETLSLRAAG